MGTTNTKYITGEELKKAVNSRIDKMYESKKQVITKEDMENSYSPEEFKAVMKVQIQKMLLNRAE